MRSAGFEHTTIRLEGGCSIQLSYERDVYNQQITTDFPTPTCVFNTAFVYCLRENKPKRDKVRCIVAKDPVYEPVALSSIRDTLRAGEGERQAAGEVPQNPVNQCG